MMGSLGDDTVLTMRSSELALCLAQSSSSSVAMNLVAPKQRLAAKTDSRWQQQHTHLHGVLFLVVLARDGDNLLATESLGPL